MKESIFIFTSRKRYKARCRAASKELQHIHKERCLAAMGNEVILCAWFLKWWGELFPMRAECKGALHLNFVQYMTQIIYNVIIWGYLTSRKPFIALRAMPQRVRHMWGSNMISGLLGKIIQPARLELRWFINITTVAISITIITTVTKSDISMKANKSTSKISFFLKEMRGTWYPQVSFPANHGSLVCVERSEWWIVGETKKFCIIVG